MKANQYVCLLANKQILHGKRIKGIGKRQKLDRDAER